MSSTTKWQIGINASNIAPTYHYQIIATPTPHIRPCTPTPQATIHKNLGLKTVHTNKCVRSAIQAAIHPNILAVVNTVSKAYICILIALVILAAFFASVFVEFCRVRAVGVVEVGEEEDLRVGTRDKAVS